jgi:thiamine-monophosphate kinase
MIARCMDLGERALIRKIMGILGDIDKDDCAIIESNDGYLVVTTDMLHRKTDFPECMSPWQMGWMTAAVNLSDIAAMGAEPSGLLIAAGVPPETDLIFLEDIFAGLRDCAKANGTRILGGDLDSHDELTLVGCALGHAEKDLILRRSGALPGDLLCTTGQLGSAGAGLRLVLSRGVGSENELAKKLLQPVPRLKEGQALAKSRAVTSMMDNSDGLALSLFDLAEASGVGFLVKEAQLPISSEVRGIAKDGSDLMDLVLYSGGDFELLFTMRPDGLDCARDVCDFTVIGEVIDDGIWIESHGARKELEPKGYEHLG